MQGRDRYYGAFTAIVIALTIGAYAWMFYDMGASTAGYHVQAQHNAKQQTASTPERVERSCAGRVGRPLRECITEAVRAGQESSYSEYDLEAQRQMSKWAFWLLIIGGGQLLVTAVGLYFIKSTLDATWKAVEDTSQATDAMRQANEIADSTAKRQLRAYVGVERIGVEGVSVGQTPSATITAKNFGQTPADQFDLISFVVFALSGHDDELVVPAGVGETRKNLPPSATSHAYPTLGKVWTQMDANFFSEGMSNIYIFGEIRYVDAFGSKHTTSFRFEHNNKCKPGLTHHCDGGNWAN